MTYATIYHNPRCGTSRNTLALLQERGIATTVIDYLKTPPDVAALTALVATSGQPALYLVRTKEALFTELGLDAPGTTDAQLVAAIAAHPILLNRPVVVTPLGVQVCRPAELVHEILPAA